MASSLLNGERAVVLLLLLRVLISTPFFLLLFESVALSLLGFVALFVEICVEASSSPPKFSTRPGASSGILLGAITLPALMFSKLIQLSRGLPLEEVSLAVYEKLGFLASSLQLLINQGACSHYHAHGGDIPVYIQSMPKWKEERARSQERHYASGCAFNGFPCRQSRNMFGS